MVAEDTIYALATPRGKAGVAVIRVSGPRALAAAAALGAGPLAPRQMHHVVLRHPVDGDRLDRALVVWFPAPRSFTGEDVVELHVHGGRAVVSGVLDALGTIGGTRPAVAGEFTRRAFLSGKIDLSEAEALADLIDAETAAQRRQALRGLDGGIGAFADAARERLIEAMALAEVSIDFTDEGDVPDDLIPAVRASALAEARRIGQLLDDARRGERLRDGLTVVVAGPPNAGKSTLLNRIAQREVAIVSPHAGTTRDAIEVHLDLDGYPVTLIDTAGMRETEDPVEREGVRRAMERAGHADLVLWLSSGGELPDAGLGGTIWRIATKIDLADAAADSGCDFCLSAQTGAGISTFLSALTAFARDSLEGGVDTLVTRERHRHALVRAKAMLERAGEVDGVELIAEELRRAADMLGRISGRIDVEDVLDVIFGRFCIGK